MKNKNFVLFLICIIGTSVLLIVFGNQRPSIQSIVKETHKQLTNLKNFKDTLQDVQEKRLNSDEKYMRRLGFTEKPRLYPASKWDNTSLPLIVTAVASGKDQLGHVTGFIRSAQHYLSNHSIIVYDLGLNNYEHKYVKKMCNSTQCALKIFQFDKYPDHVNSKTFHAFRPIIIQESLNAAGSVLWMNVEYGFVTSHIAPFLERAEKSGILAWSIEHPTSSLTHPNMFSYFGCSARDYYFHHAVEPNHLIMYNTENIHTHLMRKWIECALTFECISPIGAQANGCYDKKPIYRYSGCHHYDMSALNIILGVVFKLNTQAYTTKEMFFRKHDPSWSLLDGNSTSPTASDDFVN